MMKVTTGMVHPDLRKYMKSVSLGKPEMNSVMSMKEKDKQLHRKYFGKWFGKNSSMEEKYIYRKDGTSLRLCIIRPNTCKNDHCTGLLWLHGGGFGTGLPEQCYVYADRFLENNDTIMIIPDYRKSYEAPYPAALEDAYLTLKWMKEHACKLKINASQLFIGGESAGGGLAAALSAYARDLNEIKIAFQMPLYPMIDDRPASSINDDSMLACSTRQNQFGWQLYKGSLQDVPVYCAPARLKDFRNLPPTFSIVGTIELFYDETVTYMKHLYKAGVTIMLKEYTGCFHMFDTMYPNEKVSKEAIALEKKVFHYAQEHFFAKQEITTQETRSFQEDVFQEFNQLLDEKRY